MQALNQYDSAARDLFQLQKIEPKNAAAKKELEVVLDLCRKVNVNSNQRIGLYQDPIKTDFIERLDSIKKLINIWSARGLSIYGKVTIIKSFIIPKYFYISSILSTPKELLKELNKYCLNFSGKV